MSRFSINIKPYVDAELSLAEQAQGSGNANLAFKHLENAHVLGQAATYFHVKVHWKMLLWGFRQRSAREVLGQIFRLVAAMTSTAIKRLPQGNTGGANVSPFKAMPLKPEHLAIIEKAKG